MCQGVGCRARAELDPLRPTLYASPVKRGATEGPTKTHKVFLSDALPCCRPPVAGGAPWEKPKDGRVPLPTPGLPRPAAARWAPPPPHVGAAAVPRDIPTMEHPQRSPLGTAGSAGVSFPPPTRSQWRSVHKGGRGLWGCGGGWGGGDPPACRRGGGAVGFGFGFGFGFGDRTPGVTHDGAPDDTAHQPARPYDALLGPATGPPVAPSAFPGQAAELSCAPGPGRGAPDTWPPPADAPSLAPAHTLEGPQHVGDSSLQPTLGNPGLCHTW